MSAAVNQFLSKLASGRWILTVACAWVFVVAASSGTLSSEGVAVIITSVFKDYFNKERPAS